MKKICSKCGVEKDISEFGKDKRAKSGVRSCCKLCDKKYRENNKEKIKEYQKDNKNKLKQYQKQYCEDNKNKLKQYHKQYCEDNKEYQKQYQKQYRENNKEYQQQYNKQYCENNKDRLKQYQQQYRKTENGRIIRKLAKQRRRARKMNLPNTLTKQEWQDTLNYFDYSCVNCGAKEDLHMDHFIPLSDENNCSGTTKFNCIPLCEDCNLAKNKKNPEVFFSKELYERITKYLLAFV